MYTILILSLFLLLLAIYNANIVLWGTHSNAAVRERANKIWHALGWFIRAIPVAVALLYVYPNWPLMLQLSAISLYLGHGVYNIIINYCRGMKWDYTGSFSTGTVSWIDNLTTPLAFRLMIIAEILLVLGAFLIY